MNSDEEHLRFVYKYMSIDNLKKLIQNETLHFSRVSAFNDPFEFKACVEYNRSPKDIASSLRLLKPKEISNRSVKKAKRDPSLYPLYKEEMNRSINDALDGISVCCLSESYDNILMWSHYADSHKGVCVAFDISFFDFSSFGNQFEINRVSYMEDMPLYKFPDGFKSGIHNQVYTKSTDWAYEKEIRILNTSGSSSFNFGKESITRIIFGCETKDYIIGDVKNLITKKGFNNIEIFQMFMLNKKYKLKARKLS